MQKYNSKIIQIIHIKKRERNLALIERKVDFISLQVGLRF